MERISSRELVIGIEIEARVSDAPDLRDPEIMRSRCE
jgi:hypothetical protein